jgi:teichuronic acid biosynthesis glycosyltransferase TuaC
VAPVVSNTEHRKTNTAVRLLFISNLFPDRQEPYRGLDNAALLHALARRWEIRTLALRPMLPWRRGAWLARVEDAALKPEFVSTLYVPRMGHRWNHRLYARALRGRMERLRGEWQADVVLASWLFPDACAVAELQKEFHYRFAAIAQGTDVHEYLRIRARREIIVSRLEQAGAVITRSAELARLLGEAGLREESLHPIYNGVDFTIFHPPAEGERHAERQALDLPEFAPVILFVGNFLPIKNPHLLLDAYVRIVASPKLASTRLVLIGGGPLEAELRARAAELRAPVTFAGRLDADGVARAMRAATVLALPSDNEGVPNVVLEAFASGLPVVASRVGGIAEVHRHDFLGQLVPPRDPAALAAALSATLLAPVQPPRIAEYGRTFSWKATADAYDAILRKIAQPAR